MAQPNPASGPPTSFKTNVNRAKTKRWVEAKSYSYDGDDWGDVDDYDEYGGYDEPPPPPRPTGLRQRGQSASQPGDSYTGPPNQERQQQPYGDLGPSHPQQPYGGRSFTSPQPPQPPSLPRQNSFGQEEERRAFPGGPQHQPGGQRSATGPYPTSMLQNQPVVHDFQPGPSHINRMGPTYPGPGQPISNAPDRRSTDDRYGAQTQPPVEDFRGPQNPQQPRGTSMGDRAQSMASNNSSLDFHSRRDFSPSAMPPPLQTRGSPSPHSADSRRPPRTTSLGQDNAPSLPFQPQNPAAASSAELDPPRPQRERASSSKSDRTLPFVRPADIYKRMEEEKERQRQSQDSGRPTMDAITGRPNLDNKRNSESEQRSKQGLDPVRERQSEYGFEGMGPKHDANVKPSAQMEPAKKVPTTSKQFEIKRPSNTPAPGGRTSLGPLLPDVARMSGFGDSFGDSFMGPSGGFGDPSSTLGQDSGPFKPPTESVKLPQAPPGTDLQHTPSLGFTSAVHQSFDHAQDQVPPTPSSTADSSIGRSGSGGTSTVSPIISRGPSIATQGWESQLPGIEDVSHPPQQQQDQVVNRRPVSTSSFGGPAQVQRKPSPSEAAAGEPLNSSPPPSFIPGHRRDMSTPSPGNSPARTPAVESNKQLRNPQEVELATTTPTPTDTDSSWEDNMREYDHPNDQAITQAASVEPRGRTGFHQGPDQSASGTSGIMKSPISPAQGFRRDRTDSAGSSKVRNLADSFENGSRPQSSHSNTTPRASMLGAGMPKGDDLAPRPINERMESFRPHLPGGWESSASIAPATTLDQMIAPAGRQEPSMPTPAPSLNPAKSQKAATHTDDGSTSTTSQVNDISQDAFSAAATAGSALAGALAAAVGVDKLSNKNGEGEESEEEWEKNSESPAEPARNRGASFNTTLHPEASKLPMRLPTDDEASTAAPTPLPKDTPRHLEKEPATSGYFPTPSTENKGHIEDSNTEAAGANVGEHHYQHPSLSALNTDLQPQPPQYESDRLRREIVQELAPHLASEPSTAEADSPYQTSSRYSTNPSGGPPSGQEKGVSPNQNTSYLNDENSEDGSSTFSGEPGQVQNAKTAQLQQGAAVVGEPLHTNLTKEQAPLEAVKTSQLSEDRPHMLPHRFSWEAPLQELASQPVPTPAPAPTSVPAQDLQSAPTSDFLRSAVHPEGHPLESRETPSLDPPSRLSDGSSTVPDTSTLGLNDSQRSGRNEIATAGASHQQPDRSANDAGRDKELPTYPDDPEVTQYPAEKQFLDASSYGPADGSDRQSNPSPAPPEEPRMSPQPSVQPSTPITHRINDAPLPPAPTGAQSKIPAFREILALKTPMERIRAYDNTREQFANLNTGLAHWLAATTNDLPEHADLLSSQGGSGPAFQGHKSSPSRSKLGAIIPPSGQASNMGSTALMSAQSYSPSGASGGKISGQQVQAKSKELLHTAGVFGGKANVAAKGLFSKGKSKLRGASGTNQV